VIDQPISVPLEGGEFEAMIKELAKGVYVGNHCAYRRTGAGTT
jgi:hypothetical protein